MSYMVPLNSLGQNPEKRRSLPPNATETLKKLGADEAEMTHLRYIKWLLGVHKKTSNVGAWGDGGRPPIVLDMTRQVLEY